MLTSIDETGAGDFSTGLWRFESDQLESRVWRQQTQNPVLTESDCMRNAGLLRSKGAYFRVGQVADYAQYGSRVWINEIDLSKSEYTERLRSIIKPRSIRKAAGLHHISSSNGITAFDYYIRG
jgi:hypothetical protein